MTMKKMFKLYIVLCALCLAALCCSGMNVHMKDGRTFNSVSDLQDVGNMFFFRHNNRNQSIDKNRINKIVDNNGKIVFEHVEQLARRTLNDKREEVFVFYTNNKEVAKGNWNRNGFFEMNAYGIPDGVYKQYYDSGAIAREFSVKNRQLNGDCRVFYESGIVQREGTFVNGKENGISKLYYENGILKGESIFLNGLKNGETKLYYNSGTLKAIMNFKNGEAHGEQKTFYEGGQLETIVNIDNGKRSGPVKSYYESGKPKMEGVFRRGELHGTVTVYYESGRVKKKMNFVDGRIIER